LSVRVYAQVSEAGVGHLRTHRGDHEIDLVVERDDGRVVAIEIKLSTSPVAESVRHLDWLSRQIGTNCSTPSSSPPAVRRTDGIAVVPAALPGP